MYSLKTIFATAIALNAPTNPINSRKEYFLTLFHTLFMAPFCIFSTIRFFVVPFLLGFIYVFSSVVFHN